MQVTEIIKDETNQELISHGTVFFPLQIYTDDLEKYDLKKIDIHWHNELEFAYVIKGTVRIKVGNQSLVLEENQAILINSSVLHEIEPIGIKSNVLFTIVFDPILLGGTMQSSIFQNFVEPFVKNNKVKYIHFDEKRFANRAVLSLLLTMYLEYKKKPEGIELQLIDSLTSIWNKIYQLYTDCFQKGKIIEDSSEQRMRLLLSFIHNNYSEVITLQAIADSAHVSKSECFRSFRKYCDATPFEYLINYRLNKAIDMLKYREFTIGDIAARVGFSNSSYFAKRFRLNYGCTPSQYKRKHKG